MEKMEINSQSRPVWSNEMVKKNFAHQEQNNKIKYKTILSEMLSKQKNFFVCLLIVIFIFMVFISPKSLLLTINPFQYFFFAPVTPNFEFFLNVWKCCVSYIIKEKWKDKKKIKSKNLLKAQ